LLSVRYADAGGTPVIQPKKLYFLLAIFGPVFGLGWLAGWAAL
jgi:hypothetical protein